MRWYVAKVKAGETETAVHHLKAQKFKVYVAKGKQRRAGEWKEILMFPGYIFISFSEKNIRWRSINGTRGVSRLLGNNPEKPCPVPKKFMEALMKGLHVEDFDKVFKVGDSIRIKEGPFAGHAGKIGAVAKGRISLLLNILGGHTTVHVSTSNVGLE